VFRFFRSIFLLFKSLLIMVLFFYDFSRNRCSTAFLERSLTTLVKLAAYKRDSWPNKFSKRALFYRLFPPTFFNALRAAYLLALSGHSRSIYLSLSGSRAYPLLDLSNYFTNS
jgi:hypothetical protein